MSTIAGALPLAFGSSFNLYCYINILTEHTVFSTCSARITGDLHLQWPTLVGRSILCSIRNETCVVGIHCAKFPPTGCDL